MLGDENCIVDEFSLMSACPGYRASGLYKSERRIPLNPGAVEARMAPWRLAADKVLDKKERERERKKKEYDYMV